MYKKWFCCLLAVMSMLISALPVHAAQLLIPVGQVIGLEIDQEQLLVAAFDEALGHSAQDAGLQIGDRLLRIDGHEIKCADDIAKALQSAQGRVELEVQRGDKTRTVRIKPEITESGPKLGVYLRCGITGIGTVTWYDPETGCFGTLGHGVNDTSGSLIPLTDGTAFPASIQSVKKGKTGEPGQLRGAVQAETTLGRLERNTVQGVFGKTESGWLGEPIPVADATQLHTGPAMIRTTVQGKQPKEYAVEITKLYPLSGNQGRNMLLKVTDPALLETTGGIVQGMSGSPIIQDGRLVGAVTHVLVNDPTTGYGIFIDNMLQAAA